MFLQRSREPLTLRHDGLCNRRPFYRVTVKHLSTSRRNAASEQLFSLPTTKKWDTVKHTLIENLRASCGI
jgi:hypothetical protein